MNNKFQRILKNKILRFFCVILLEVICLITAGVAYVLITNEYSIELNIEDGQVIRIEYGSGDTLPVVKAVYKGTILKREGIQVEVVQDKEVDFEQIGTYTIIYTAEYKNTKTEAAITVQVEDNLPPVIELVSDEGHITSPISVYEEEGYSAVDNYDGDITKNVIREEKDGVVYYKVSDSSGNVAETTRNIIYKDVVLPVLTLNGDTVVKLDVGTTFVEPGYVAVDDCDGDITHKVEVKGTVNSNELGTYNLVYSVKDSYGNTADVTRSVIVGDYIAPQITLNGNKRQYICIGSKYLDMGCHALDNYDGDVTSQVSVSGDVDTSKTGYYTIKYQVKDSSGNIGTVNRDIYVYEKQIEENVVNPGNKVIYLTFDDGPGRYTEKLLKILDKYGVKATFFVTNQQPKYKYLIGRAYSKGHTIALHTYSHNYSIYTDEKTYYKDLKMIEDICIEQTGVKPGIVRFPGGSSNAVSKKYCTGIMTALGESISYHGYLYCDWNVSSGDANGTLSTEQVVNNVINGIKRKNVSVVLQHDIYDYSVNAVEEIIMWGLSNGYTFLPLTETSPMIHHNICN